MATRVADEMKDVEYIYIYIYIYICDIVGGREFFGDAGCCVNCMGWMNFSIYIYIYIYIYRGYFVGDS